MVPLVLCYHAVSPTWEHRLSIQPGLLLRQVRLLSRFRRVHVTFDDAFRNATSVFPDLEQRGFSITIFVCAAFARDGSPLAIPELAGDAREELATMTWDELRGLAERGIGIQSHGISHAHLTHLSDDELRTELVDSKAEIEDELRRRCDELAYPYGEHDERVRAAAGAAGYSRGFGLWHKPTNDAYAERRLDLYRRHTPMRALLMTTPLHRFAA